MTARFKTPEEPADGWADVRMTDPDVGEWDVDAVVMDGRVEYVDLRIKPELLAGFVSCLLEDMDDEHVGAVLSRVCERRGLDTDVIGSAGDRSTKINDEQ